MRQPGAKLVSVVSTLTLIVAVLFHWPLWTFAVLIPGIFLPEIFQMIAWLIQKDIERRDGMLIEADVETPAEAFEWLTERGYIVRKMEWEGRVYVVGSKTYRVPITKVKQGVSFDQNE